MDLLFQLHLSHQSIPLDQFLQLRQLLPLCPLVQLDQLHRLQLHLSLPWHRWAHLFLLIQSFLLDLFPPQFLLHPSHPRHRQVQSLLSLLSDQSPQLLLFLL